MTRTQTKAPNKKDELEAVLSDYLKSNVDYFLKTFENCGDLTCKTLFVGDHQDIKIAILYIDTLIDTKIINKDILEPLLLVSELETLKTNEDFLIFLKESRITVGNVEYKNNFQELIAELLSGKAILLMEQCHNGLTIDCKMFRERNIIEPLMESVNRGARDGFTELINTNISLVRQRLKDPSLKIRKLIIGERTKTDVVMLYLDDIANEDAINDVHARLSKMVTDGILESGYIEEYLESNPYSLFPQVDTTERPDKVVACLLEGRIAVIVNGTPIVCIVPSFFLQFFHSPEDYYQRSIYSGFIRMFRFLSAILTTALPAAYLAFVSFHSQLIPFKFIELLLNGRSQLPFPATIEVVIMLFLVDLIQEASSRLLGRVGQATGIVGSIVLGQAAISANLAAPTTIVIVSATLLTSYVLPSYVMEVSFRIIRYLLIMVASFLGIYGVAVMLLWFLIHLCSLESVGAPYLAPIAPLRTSNLQDTFIRMPLRKMRKRPLSIEPKDIIRQKDTRGN